jgi:hypothetical protein
MGMRGAVLDRWSVRGGKMMRFEFWSILEWD